MARAFAEAEAAAARDEVPVGAVLVEAATGRVLAAAGNRTEADADPSAHAEILAIRAAATTRGRPRLPDCDLYVTLEPCAMCAAADQLRADPRRVIYGTPDPKMGAVDHGPRFLRGPADLPPPAGGDWRGDGRGVGGAAARLLPGEAPAPAGARRASCARGHAVRMLGTTGFGLARISHERAVSGAVKAFETVAD